MNFNQFFKIKTSSSAETQVLTCCTFRSTFTCTVLLLKLIDGAKIYKKRKLNLKITCERLNPRSKAFVVSLQNAESFRFTQQNLLFGFEWGKRDPTVNAAVTVFSTVNFVFQKAHSFSPWFMSLANKRLEITWDECKNSFDHERNTRKLKWFWKKHMLINEMLVCCWKNLNSLSNVSLQTCQKWKYCLNFVTTGQ